MCARWTSAHEQGVLPDALSANSASQCSAVSGVFASGAGVTWITRGEVARTVALRLVSVDSTQGIQATTNSLARIANLTLTGARDAWIPIAARIASTLVTVCDLATLCIDSTRFSEALVTSCESKIQYFNYFVFIKKI